MDALAKVQKELGGSIESGYSNFKKDSQQRKTITYCQKRKTILEEKWSCFQKNHEVLDEFSKTHSEHPYFANSYYEQVKEVVRKHMEGLEEILGQDRSIQTTNEQSKEINTEKHNEVIHLLRRQKALIKHTRQMIAEISEKLVTSQSPQFYKFKAEMLQKQKQMLDENLQAIWVCYENYEHSEDEQEYDKVDCEVQRVIIELYEHIESIPKTPQSIHPQIESAKLPAISLPTFDGNYNNWMQFKDLFDQMIDKSSISPAQKMFYLVGKLSGEARTLIQHLPVCDRNYEVAWSLLKQRYQNDRLLVNALISRLLSQQAIQAESAASVKKLHDTTKESLMGLQNLGIHTDHWDAIVSHIILRKLDKATHMLYEQALENPRSLDSTSKVLSFLEMRFQTLEATMGKQSAENKTSKRQRTSVLVANQEKDHCVACPELHPLFACKEFNRQPIAKRREIVQRANLCRNCLKPGHRAAKCTRGFCTKCKQKHNTLLHSEDEPEKPKAENQKSLKQPCFETTKTALVSQPAIDGPSHVILGTINVIIKAANGRSMQCRALLDTGSQLNFITEKVAKKLAITGIVDPISIQGISTNRSIAQRRVQVQVHSRLSTFKLDLDAFVLKTITSNQPATQLDASAWKIPEGIQLADPEFYTPAPIDLLIGAEHCFDVQIEGRVNLGKGLPTLQNTSFGWMVAGKMSQPPKDNIRSRLVGTRETLELNQQMERFWELETVETSAPIRTSAEKKCEAHFRETTKRNPDGRFIVRLPFAENPSALGESKEQAQNRFLAIERRFSKNPDLKHQYVRFMQEYISLEHMTEVTNLPALHYFLPHHSVQKPDSDTTKLRVVFDGSAKTSSHLSLNDILFTGPKVQEDLFSVLLRFRFPRYVCSADIEKMYRQVLVDTSDRNYQMIVWRENPHEALRYYQLNTVTYGLTAAPYLAIRCLHRLAEENLIENSLGAKVIRENMYVDDAMFGANTLSEALETQRQLIAILRQGGFRLRKWCANHAAFTKDLPSDDVVTQLDLLDETDHQVKALGLRWLPKADELRIIVNYNDNPQVTKRQVLSDIAHLFDPLGLMGPVTVTAKLMLQKLWSLNLDWDDVIPQELLDQWCRFRQNLSALSDISIPRHVSAHHHAKEKQLHVFCDASEKAYGAAVYIRSSIVDGTIVVRLLCAKSRIAPLKPVTLPRLELCAAKLGAELAERVRIDLQWSDPIHLWTDSEIVLSWIRSPASSLQKFVGNRIAAIQDVTSTSQWKHVLSRDNPADLISRGLAPEKLKQHQQWFYGPMFLHQGEHRWPKKSINADTTLERKQPDVTLVATQTNRGLLSYLAHISNINKMKRVVAYILRFIKNSKTSTRALQGSLSVLELEEAMNLIVREVQKEAFPTDLIQLKKYKGINPTSNLAGLSPFLDEHELMRVGGRLQNANISYEAKHPILLPQNHHITRLIMRQVHYTNDHVRQAGLLAITRQNYWPLHGKSIARSIVDKCIICARERPKLLQQIMGDLPKDRVQPSRPFIRSGVDFCGPFYVRTEIRGRPPQKAYIALFCCFATKAVHLEVVKNLTTDAFIQALRRFVGRRGNCNTIYCDNATNFVGANNQLRELRETIHDSNATQLIKDFCSQKKISFNFIPPRAPHFGGLWEAAVKSAKQLFVKSVANKPLTYEELTTLTVEIEAILNSRPLTPLSMDPNDLTALTPGHLLIGDPVNATVDPFSQLNTLSLVDRWKELTRIKQDFWNRWSKEYLSELQQRHKWKTPNDNIQNGALVIVKEDNVPSLSWPLGRIINTIQGADGRVRVVEIKTSSGIIKRPIHKVAPLPIELDKRESTSSNTDASSLEPVPGPSSGSKEAETDKADPTRSTSTSRSRTRKASESSPSTSKRRKGMSWALTMLLAVCFILPTKATTPTITITPFQGQPGLYFERLGSASLIADEWTMVVFYSMDAFWKEYAAIRQTADQLNTFCTRMHDPESCEETMTYLQSTLRELSINNNILSTNRTRIKRSPLDIIGNIANSLFGVLDSQYAQHMSRVINNLESNDQYLLELMKNQTTIINSTANIIQSSHDDTTQRLQQFYEFLNKTVDTVNSISKAIDTQRILEVFNSLSIRMILAISNFQRIQTTLLNVLVDTHHGKVSPLLLTPAQLHNQIQLIKENIPAHLCPPANADNLIELYGIMTIEGRLVNDQIIFRIKLPLLKDSNFELLKNTPIPSFSANSSYALIHPDSQYMLVNLHRDQYYRVSETELQTKCYKVQGSNRVCRMSQSPVDIHSSPGGCAINILLHSSEQPICKISTVRGEPHWTQLQIDNHWIYAMRDNTLVSVICDSQITQQHLHGVGIVALSPGCTLKYGRNSFEATNRQNTLILHPVVHTRNISEIIPIRDDNQLLPPDPGRYHDPTGNIRKLQQRLEIMHQNTVLPKLSHHDVHQYSISYLTFFLILTLILYGSITCYRARMTKPKQPPSPAPRQSKVSADPAQPASEFMVNIQD